MAYLNNGLTVGSWIKAKDINDQYEIDTILKEFDASVPVKDMAELLKMLEAKGVDFEARVLAKDPNSNHVGVRTLTKKEFIEAHKAKHGDKLRESLGGDAFGTDLDVTSDRVGNDYVPLLGGPFYKNLYFYDYIKQANAAFYAYHHDPIARQAVNIIKEFTLGRGYRVDCKNKKALSIWQAFSKANNLDKQLDQLATELSVNGEIMLWWLPDNQASIVQAPFAGQKIPKALLPRVRLTDATVFWEIVTIPEDINEVLYYVWVAPTQWQLYSGLAGEQKVPTSKFIFQTIPAEQIDHFKINCFYNEKRGRSDLFPVLGYLKRLRDSVTFSQVALQKQAAWSFDTEIDGSPQDIQDYLSDVAGLGSMPPAGSEYVHSSKVKRQLLSPAGGGKGSGSNTFEWALSMVASGMGIPISYFGTHLSGGSTRASAIVSTEPIAKRLEARQKVYEEILHKCWDRVMQWATDKGYLDYNEEHDCEVTFPSIITQDRAEVISSLQTTEQLEVFSKRRIAQIIAKEFNQNDFDFDEEQATIDEEKKDGIYGMLSAPLTAPPAKPANAVTGEERNDVKDYGSNL